MALVALLAVYGPEARSGPSFVLCHASSLIGQFAPSLAGDRVEKMILTSIHSRQWFSYTNMSRIVPTSLKLLILST